MLYSLVVVVPHAHTIHKQKIGDKIIYYKGLAIKDELEHFSVLNSQIENIHDKLNHYCPRFCSSKIRLLRYEYMQYAYPADIYLANINKPDSIPWRPMWEEYAPNFLVRDNIVTTKKEREPSAVTTRQ